MIGLESRNGRFRRQGPGLSGVGSLLKEGSIQGVPSLVEFLLPPSPRSYRNCTSK